MPNQQMFCVRYLAREPSKADRAALELFCASKPDLVWTGIGAPNAEGRAFKAWLVDTDCPNPNADTTRRLHAEWSRLFGDLLDDRGLTGGDHE